MADYALFVGWGDLVSGRERIAAKVFNEAVAWYMQLQQEGEIESFEPVLLQPHGGDLAGFILVRGEQQKLAMLQSRDEFLRLNQRARVVVSRFGVVNATCGATAAAEVAEFEAHVADLVG